MLNSMMARDVTSMVWASDEFRERGRDFLEKRRMKRKRFVGTMP
jgi:hypothetical protein